MSRPIKFRAWDGDEKRMCHKVYVGSEGWHGEYWENDLMIWSFTDDQHPNNVLMQFTGLTDCKGREIWEGDILRSPVSDLSNDTMRFPVEFVGGFYKFFTKYKDSEVLGNVHEHPHLLRKEFLR